MKTLYISDIENRIGEEVELFGWVYRQREHGGVVFVVLRDSTGIVQISIHKNNVNPDSFNNAQKVTIESSVRVKGKVIEDSRAPTGLEIRCSEFEILSLSEKFPIQEGAGKEFLLDVRHLALRSIRLTEIMKIKELIIQGARKYLQKNGWHEVFPPIITSAACEGGTTLFSIDYYGREAYLSQSAQLYLETAIYSLEKVYSLTPSFRAEKSKTRRENEKYDRGFLLLVARYLIHIPIEEVLCAATCQVILVTVSQ